MITHDLARNQRRSERLSDNNQLSGKALPATNGKQRSGRPRAPPAIGGPNKELENKGLILWHRNCSPSNSGAIGRPRGGCHREVAPYGVESPNTYTWQPRGFFTTCHASGSLARYTRLTLFRGSLTRYRKLLIAKGESKILLLSMSLLNRNFRYMD